MKIHLLLTNPSFFNDLGRDNCNEVWIKLKNTLEKNGSQLHLDLMIT